MYVVFGALLFWVNYLSKNQPNRNYKLLKCSRTCFSSSFILFAATINILVFAVGEDAGIASFFILAPLLFINSIIIQIKVIKNEEIQNALADIKSRRDIKNGIFLDDVLNVAIKGNIEKYPVKPSLISQFFSESTEDLSRKYDIESEEPSHLDNYEDANAESTLNIDRLKETEFEDLSEYVDVGRLEQKAITFRREQMEFLSRKQIIERKAEDYVKMTVAILAENVVDFDEVYHETKDILYQLKDNGSEKIYREKLLANVAVRFLLLEALSKLIAYSIDNQHVYSVQNLEAKNEQIKLDVQNKEKMEHGMNIIYRIHEGPSCSVHEFNTKLENELKFFSMINQFVEGFLYILFETPESFRDVFQCEGKFITEKVNYFSEVLVKDYLKRVDSEFHLHTINV